jgi:thymidylate synthase
VTEVAPEVVRMTDLLARIHRPKDRAYGDAWRKRGEVLGIFANIARKYDRLVIAMDENGPAATETLGDTVADLCIYAGKYTTWLAEMEPAVFDTVGLNTEASAAAAQRGPEALEAIFRELATWDHARDHTRPRDIADAFQQVRGTFENLEHGLVTQASGQSGLSITKKVELALDLTYASCWLLVHLDAADPEISASLRAQAEAMEETP